MNPWDLFKEGILWVIKQLYTFCGDWGLAIILITIIFRALMIPIMHKQTKSSYMMKKLNPKMNKIKEMYADDKVKQSNELQKIYADAKYNPISGCIPMLIQIPIFMALFQVLRWDLVNYVGDEKCSFYNIVPNLFTSPSEAFQAGFITAIPYLLLLLIFAGATFVPMLLQQTGQDEKQKKTMYITSGVMSIFMIFVGWGSPAGVLLFWGASSLLALLQQQISMWILKRKDEELEEEKEYEPVEVNIVRQQRAKRPRKKK